MRGECSILDQGKCTRAYHVTCAMESSEVDFEEVEVQEWVCKKQKPTEQSASTPATSHPREEGMDVDAAVPQEPQAIPVEETGKKQYSLVKIVHTKLFCPTHNIVSLVVQALCTSPAVSRI